MSSASSQHSAPSKHASTDVDDNGVSRVQIHGDGGEFVTINGQKFYRHELMAAFGGTLNPGAIPYPKININPAPIGLSGFALTTFVLSLVNARAMGITIPNAVVSLACFYGGLVQFLAGFYGAIFIERFGIAAAYKDTDQFNNAVAFFLLAWALFTFLLVLNTMKSTWAFFSLFFFLFLTFLLLAGGEFSGRVGVTRAGGVIGTITAFIAWYNAFAGTATRLNSYLVPHPIPMPTSIPFRKHK
ncbi:membrane transporter protein [Candida parapsilosis]|uniref:Membrane transporter protein n=1 Tax=Candida parapsilosis TaxID=5480 RepID=A0A8X7NHN3_CANPA|nr:membrane transporter protein [Candida parapsilosis]KAF6048904.1 membrane transporter protein [Candida parapsilosis]